MTTQNLKEAVKALNESGLLEKNIKTVAVKAVDMEKAFLDAVNNIPEDKEEAIPDLVVDAFNILVKENGLPVAAPVSVKKNGKKDKPVKEKKEKAAKAKKGEVGPGIIATIKEILAKGPITKDKILEKLVSKFPDRPEAGMKGTVNVQISRLKATKSDKGYSV